MTYEEAIKIMENEKQCVIRAENCNRNCAECDLLMPAKEIIEAYKITKTAIEKQIPKKPKNFLRNMHTQEYLCPLCKTRIISKINGEFIAGSKDKYCSHCGQAIDWNGEN